MSNLHIIIKPKAYVLSAAVIAIGAAIVIFPKLAPKPAAPEAPKSYVQNPSFEDVKGKVPVHWTNWVKGEDQSATSVVAYAETQHDAHSGQWHGTHYGGDPYNAYTFQIVKGLPKGNYTLRAWVQSTGGQTVARMQAEQFDALGTKKTIAIAQGEQWHQVEITDIQVTKGECMVGFWSESPGGRWLMFDDVELVKVD